MAKGTSRLALTGRGRDVRFYQIPEGIPAWVWVNAPLRKLWIDRADLRFAIHGSFSAVERDKWRVFALLQNPQYFPHD